MIPSPEPSGPQVGRLGIMVGVTHAEDNVCRHFVASGVYPFQFSPYYYRDVVLRFRFRVNKFKA